MGCAVGQHKAPITLALACISPQMCYVILSCPKVTGGGLQHRDQAPALQVENEIFLCPTGDVWHFPRDQWPAKLGPYHGLEVLFPDQAAFL